MSQEEVNFMLTAVWKGHLTFTLDIIISRDAYPSNINNLNVTKSNHLQIGTGKRGTVKVLLTILAYGQKIIGFLPV